MNERRIRTQGEPIPDDFTDGGTITRLRIEAHKGAGLSQCESVIPREIGSSEPTARYPIGLREDLCSLSSCRHRAPARQHHW
jgi:hypothetical protein